MEGQINWAPKQIHQMLSPTCPLSLHLKFSDTLSTPNPQSEEVTNSFKHNLFPVFIPCYALLNISRRLSKRKHPKVYTGHTIK